MRLVSAEALGSIYADSQIAVALLPFLEHVPVPVGGMHLPLKHASDEH